jgi:hypothetical protein
MIYNTLMTLTTINLVKSMLLYIYNAHHADFNVCTRIEIFRYFIYHVEEMCN